MESGKKAAFTLEVVELGLDDDLEAVTSCVVAPASVSRRKLQSSPIHPSGPLKAQQGLGGGLG